MLSAFRRNSLSIALSTVAISGYGAWLSLPDSASIHSIYERYIAREESRPRVFEEGVVIRLNREAPPVAALEEALRDQPWTSIERAPGFNVRPTELRALPAAPERIAIRILSENERFQRALESRTLEASATPPTYVAPPLLSPLTTPINAPVTLPRNRMRAQTGDDRRGVSYVAGPDAAVAGRPIEKLSEPPVKTISLSKLGITREQMLAALLVPMSYNSPPAAGRTRIGRAQAGAQQPQTPPRNQALVDDVVVAENASIASRAMGMVAPVGRQITIRGTIELSGGLALTHAQDRIAVLRESRGQFIESGAVWIREARYEIFVESLEGLLVAEVRSPQGEVVGRGHLELATINAGQKKSVDGVALRVSPVSAGIAGRAQSAYTTSSASGATSQGLQGARVDFQGTPSTVKSVSGGHFEDARFTEGSRVVAKIQAKEHWPTLSMLTSGSEPIIPLFSKKMMQAFVSLTSKDETTATELAKTKGVIWGRVTRAGQTIANAEVTVLTQGTAEPIYFNELMIPDASMKMTGANGLFAVPAVMAGAHAVQIRIGKRLSDPVFMQADAQSVASVELDVLKASEIESRAFDAFKIDSPVRVEIRPSGHVKSRRVIVEGEKGAVVKLANLGLPSVLEIDGGPDYLATRMIQNPETRHLFLPMVQRAWFDRAVGRLRFNNFPQTGNVIGFIQGTRFRVSLAEAALAANAKILYFDARGEVTAQEYGEPGGGFILLGVNNGFQTIMVEAEGSERVYAAAVLVQDGIVASLSHWLR